MASLITSGSAVSDPGVRDGMSYIVAEVEQMINNTALSIATCVVQDALDDHRYEARLLPLEAIRTVSSAGSIQRKEFRAPRPYTHWETTASLYDAGYESLSPASHNSRYGLWTFTDEESRPVRISGYSYDVNAAAADLLERRAAEKAEEVQSFSTANGTFSFAAKGRSIREQARQFRKRARSGYTRLERRDVSPFEQW